MSRFDQKLAAGEGVVGTFSHLGGPAVAECLSLSGLDYVIIDTEHGPFPDESTGEMIRAIELHSAEAFVRVRDSSRAAVLHALDLGARGIIIPDVQSVEEARRLVEYAKYYPLGARGFAFSRSAKYGFLPELKQIGDYFTATNQRTILMPQCETAGALEHIEEIAALDGIDGIFVGPYDLSVALGAPGAVRHPAVCRGSRPGDCGLAGFRQTGVHLREHHAGSPGILRTRLSGRGHRYGYGLSGQGHSGHVAGVTLSGAPNSPVRKGRGRPDSSREPPRGPGPGTACLRAGACLKTALHRQPHPALPSPCDPAGLPGGGAISGGRIGI